MPTSVFSLTSGFLQIPPHVGHPCLRLTLPTAERVVVFHHLVVAHAGRTYKKRGRAVHPLIPSFVLFVGQRFLNPVTVLLWDVERLHGLLRRHVQILHQVSHGRNPRFLAALPNALPASLLDSLFKVTIAGFDAGKNLPCGPRLRANGCDGDVTACGGLWFIPCRRNPAARGASPAAAEGCCAGWPQGSRTRCRSAPPGDPAL